MTTAIRIKKIETILMKTRTPAARNTLQSHYNPICSGCRIKSDMTNSDFLRNHKRLKWEQILFGQSVLSENLFYFGDNRCRRFNLEQPAGPTVTVEHISRVKIQQDHRFAVF